ncbi:hypothetical protein LCGC14_2834860 [marine sediment metagenome]|uniref:Uncharacterized protein n=1 Tax=marine sediment metagenome TaxID=412755 RepID=A0A0F8YCW2_9ZZZZ
MKFTQEFEIPDNRFDEMKARFLTSVKMPLNEDGSDKYTFKELHRQYCIRQTKIECANGKLRMDASASDTIEIT